MKLLGAVDKAKGHVSVSLKKSAVQGTLANKFTFDMLEVGMVVAGEVKKVESFGIFVYLSNSKLQGLCHISQVRNHCPRTFPSVALLPKGSLLTPSPVHNCRRFCHPRFLDF